MYWTKEYMDYKEVELIGDAYIPAVATKLLIANGKGSNKTKRIVNIICSNDHLAQLAIKRGIEGSELIPVHKRLGSAYEYYIGGLILEGKIEEVEKIILEDIVSQCYLP